MSVLEIKTITSNLLKLCTQLFVCLTEMFIIYLDKVRLLYTVQLKNLG